VVKACYGRVSEQGPGEKSLHTDLQMNHTTRRGIEHHRIGWS